jgi:hypothetical protein
VRASVTAVGTLVQVAEHEWERDPVPSLLHEGLQRLLRATPARLPARFCPTHGSDSAAR